MKNIYEECPILENDRFLLRKIEEKDVKELVKVYGDKNALPFFNSDNCHGDNFYMPTEEIMKKAIEFWNREYDRRGFVRFSIIDKKINEAIGTIELFNRKSEDYFNNCGLLRLDLRSDYEREDIIFNILSFITKRVYELFDCNMVATKARNYAIERIAALNKAGYVKSEEKLVGTDGTQYGDYYATINV